MLDVLIGILSSIVLVVVYSFLEKRRVHKIGYIAYVFMFLVTVASVIATPSENIWNWLIWLLFFYTVLDDMRTKTVYAPVYVLTIFFLFLHGQPLGSLVFAIIITGIFLLFAHKTKETFLSVGDVYCLLPLIFWLEGQIFVSLILALFMAASILPIVSLFYKAKYYAFTPFLVLAAIIVQAEFHVEWVFTISLIVNILMLGVIKISHKKKKK